MIYLDNAATTMRKPPQVVQAVVKALESIGNAGRGAYHASLDASRIIYDTRVKLVEFFGGDHAEQVAFTANSTESLNLAIKGLFYPGDHIITTALEHNSVLRPLSELSRSGIITLNTAVPKGCLQIYNDLNHDLYNLLFCVKHRPMALTKELSFLPINARDEFDVLRRQLQGEDFTQLYLDEELQLAEQMFPPPEAEEVKRLLQSRAELSDVRRAAAIYKLQRYSYNGNGDSYGVSSCDIQRFFRDIWECSHRLKDVALENKDFESIITTHNDPQTTVYCDPPYYEAERYAVEFPRSDHQRLHDVLAQHTGFAMVSYNNCDYIRRLYEDFFIYEVERPNSQSKKKNDIYREYIMTNYDPRVFASQMTIFGDYSSDGKICRLVHIPERPLRT